MSGHLLVLLATAATVSSGATAYERNYTIRGNGYVDGTGVAGRLDLSEVRMTLRDNGYFAVTLFVRGERVLVVGNWDRRGASGERISIRSVGGQWAQGSGSLAYRRDGDSAPERMVLEGRTRRGSFNVMIQEWGYNRGGTVSDPGVWNRDTWDPRGRTHPSRRVVLRRSIDATSYGNGIVRMAGVRGGDFSTVRVRIGTNGDVRLDIDNSTRGRIQGELRGVNGNRYVIYIEDMFGFRASGELSLEMRNNEVSRIDGYGTSSNGSWQFDFDGSRRGRR